MAVSVLAPITPSVLSWARQQAAVSVPELARRVNVTEDRIHAWETGAASPTVAMLRIIAGTLKQPMALFFAKSPPERGIHVPPDFRTIGAAPGRRLTREVRLAEERREVFKRLAPLTVGESTWPTWAQDQPVTPAETRTRLGVTVDAVAQARNDQEALRLWIAAVENQGILVFQMSRVTDDECSGFCVYDATTPVIVLNGSQVPQRRIFTLLHEFGHLVRRSGGLCGLDESVDEEQACSRFAESVLLPPRDVHAAINGTSGINAVAAVAKRFHVSRIAAAIALKRRGEIDQQVVDDELRRSEEARKHATDHEGGPPPERLQRRNLGDVYLTTVLDAMDSETISVADATYFLDAKVGMIDKLERELVGSSQ